MRPPTEKSNPEFRIKAYNSLIPKLSAVSMIPAPSTAAARARFSGRPARYAASSLATGPL
ncbi:MAG: hypothetical protein AAGB06_00020 [Verrucomicrobiota bacterium]